MIRHATRSDVPAMVEMARSFLAESQVPLPFDQVYSTHVFLDHIHDEQAVAFLVEIDRKPVGMLCASLVKTRLAPVLFAQEHVFWIDPDCRGGKWAMGLIKAYVAWAKSYDCHLVGISSLGDDRVASLYARLGFEPADCNFMKVI